uniref:Uncharacterized protein n=1 Tax=Leersia perrieri TaxID=77586 RepID=A0A0D9X989_9ORYZ
MRKTSNELVLLFNWFLGLWPPMISPLSNMSVLTLLPSGLAVPTTTILSSLAITCVGLVPSDIVLTVPSVTTRDGSRTTPYSLVVPGELELEDSTTDDDSW